MRREIDRDYHEAYPHSPSFLNGLVIGMVAGAASYFLFATKKGKKVRKQLVEQAQKGWDEMGEVMEKAEKTGKKLKKDVKKIRKKVEQETQKTQVKAEKELEQLESKVLQAREKADQMQEKLKKTAEKIEKRFFTKSGRSLGK